MISTHIGLMNKSAKKNSGMDVIIITASSQKHQALLQNRLNELKGTLIKPSAYIFCVFEDWPNGAGNGLGTLYAFQKAREMGKTSHGIDLLEKLDHGESIALYHTAGDGLRMFPLTASEEGCKPLIKLPGRLDCASTQSLMSSLEAVIKQTSLYALAGRGRLSVFWSDQVFIPNNPIHENSQAHVDILAQYVPFPNEGDWKAKGYANYGIVHPEEKFLIEKIDYNAYREVLNKYHIQASSILGLSLGCFSLSLPMLKSLMDFFQHDLAAKHSKLHTDLHFWMPLMHDQETYINLMNGKNSSVDFARLHFSRMKSFKDVFRKTHQGPLFAIRDIGSDSFWWDFGTVSKYYHNNMLALKQNAEGHALRQFYGWDAHNSTSQYNPLSCDPNSLLYNCRIASGSIKNSILVNVTADHVEIQDSLILNSTFRGLKADRNLIYNCHEKEDCELKPEYLKVDVTLEALKRHLKFIAPLEKDVQEDWENCLPPNPLSFAELNQLIHSI